MEIGVEGEVNAVSLWWEIPPAIRKKQGVAEMALGGREGRSRVVVTHVRDGVWEKSRVLDLRNSVG